MGNAYKNKGDIKRAIQEYKRALAINPKNTAGRINLGFELNNVGLYQEALHEFLEALNINPNIYQAYYGLGFSYLLLEQVAKAREFLHKFVKNAPSSAHNYIKSANIMLQSTENEDDAEKFIKSLQNKLK